MDYKYKALKKKRRELGLKLEDVVKKLTLSTTQIKSLEENKKVGFINQHFFYISLKKYAKFLQIDLNNLIPAKKSSVLNDKEEMLSRDLGIDKIKKYKKIILKIYFFPLLILLLIYIYQKNTTIEKENSKDDYLLSNIEPIEITKNEINPLKDQESEFPIIEYDDIKASNNSIEFLCTIQSSSVKNFSTKAPEKPSKYFHIVSLKKQSICTIDQNEVFKQYSIEEGGKVTHFGKPPFKIQLDPTISELYFEGWKVRLKENDSFIQLSPREMP